MFFWSLHYSYPREKDSLKGSISHCYMYVKISFYVLVPTLGNRTQEHKQFIFFYYGYNVFNLAIGKLFKKITTYIMIWDIFCFKIGAYLLSTNDRLIPH